jgi:hypothetical protein
MGQPATLPGSGPQAKVLDMSVTCHADVIVLNRRPGPALLPRDLALECRPVRAPGPGEVVVRNIVTSVDPYQLRMLCGSPEVYVGIHDVGHVRAGSSVLSAPPPAPWAGWRSSWPRPRACAWWPSRAAGIAAITPSRCWAPTSRSTTAIPRFPERLKQAAQ